MAKAEKMNRGVSSKAQRSGGTEINLPEGVHSVDNHGNVYASIPELSRVSPRYFTMEQLKEALAAEKLTTLDAAAVQLIEDAISKK